MQDNQVLVFKESTGEIVGVIARTKYSTLPIESKIKLMLEEHFDYKVKIKSFNPPLSELLDGLAFNGEVAILVDGNKDTVEIERTCIY